MLWKGSALLRGLPLAVIGRWIELIMPRFLIEGGDIMFGISRAAKSVPFSTIFRLNSSFLEATGELRTAIEAALFL